MTVVKTGPGAAGGPPLSPSPAPVGAAGRLSVIVPVYNERNTLPDLLERVGRQRLSRDGRPVAVEVIVVDDCSNDGGVDFLEQPAGRTAFPGVRLIRHPHNRGKGAAIRTALAAATGDYVIIQDADFEYDPADVPRLLAPVLAGRARVVYGARPLDGAGGRWLLDAGNRALTVLTNLLYGTRLHDMETCYKLLPTALVRGFRLECSRFDLEPEITAKVTRSGERILEVPISYHPRAGGKKLSVRRDGLPALQALLRYRTWKPAAQSPG
jgi:glycosyltransferase involved in cell wall biosynthesis